MAKYASTIFQNHIGHNITTEIDNNKLVVKCQSCEETIHDEFYCPDTYIIAGLSVETIMGRINDNCELDDDDLEEVEKSLNSVKMEEIGYILSEYTNNESYDLALDNIISKITENYLKQKEKTNQCEDIDAESEPFEYNWGSEIVEIVKKKDLDCGDFRDCWEDGYNWSELDLYVIENFEDELIGFMEAALRNQNMDVPSTDILRQDLEKYKGRVRIWMQEDE